MYLCDLDVVALGGADVGHAGIDAGLELAGRSPKVRAVFSGFAPYWWPGGTNAGDYLLFLGVTLGISVVLVVAMTMRLRSLCISEPLRKLRKPFSPANGGNMWRVLTAAIPALTPSLDGNPVVWRECAALARRGG